MYFILLSVFALNANPWNLDVQARELLKSQIDAKYEQKVSSQASDYVNDYDQTPINFYSDVCPLCQNQSDHVLEERLAKAGFKKRRDAHCFGVTLFFVRYLLDHPEIQSNSCAKILSEVAGEPNFKEAAHRLQVNQQRDYFFEEIDKPLEPNVGAMKVFFETLMGRSPVDYYIPECYNALFDEMAICATLQSLPNDWLIIGYETRDHSLHCIAVFTGPEKPFVFDSSLGLYQFADVETLSRASGKVLEGCKFRWLVAFSNAG